MDKYQEYIIKKLYERVCSYTYNSPDVKDAPLTSLNEGTFVIKQNEDITIKKYNLRIKNDAIEMVFAIKNEIEIPFEIDSDKFIYLLDFDNKIDSVKIVFKHGVADDLVIPVEFIEADKEAYYAKKEAERIAELHRKAAISCATGVNLVNIYFQPCSEKYAKTEITLYRNEFMIAKYLVEGELYFKAISDLACGSYSFVLKQFRADGEVLLETKHINFFIELSIIKNQNSGRNVHYSSF